MRDYGKTPDGEDIAWLGLSARVPEINAIVAYYNFGQMDQLIARRQELINRYKAELAGLAGVTFQEIKDDRQTSGNYLTIFIDSNKARHPRDEVYQFLKERQIQAKKYFYPALHLQKVYLSLGRPYKGKLPVTEKAAISGLALPCFSHMSEEMVFTVIDSVRTFLQ